MALPENLKPGRAGQESGRYLPLQENELDLIHEQVIRVLEKIGLADAIPSCIEVMTAQGCTMTESGRLLIPRKVIEETLEKGAKEMTLYGQTLEHDMLLGGRFLHEHDRAKHHRGRVARRAWARRAMSPDRKR